MICGKRIWQKIKRKDTPKSVKGASTRQKRGGTRHLQVIKRELHFFERGSTVGRKQERKGKSKIHILFVKEMAESYKQRGGLYSFFWIEKRRRAERCRG